MAMTDLEKLHILQLEIAKEIHRVCEVLGIHYFLDSGTMLGAVRHKGFIPWDDDMDTGMLREDYEVFLEKAPAIIDNERFFLQSYYNDKEYAMGYAKLRLLGTKHVEKVAPADMEHTEIYVDIFPYDPYPQMASKKEQLKRKKRYGSLSRYVLVKCGYEPWKWGNRSLKKTILYQGIRIISLFSSKSSLIKKCDKVAMLYQGQDTGYLAPQEGPNDYGEYIIKKQDLDELALYEFEGVKLWGPKNYDSYLKDMYGDYMTLPPEEEREERRYLVGVDFGKYASMFEKD